MRRASLLIGIALAGCLILGGSISQAQENKWVRGTVTAVAGETVTVKVAGQDMIFAVDQATEVVERGAGTAGRAAQAQGAAGAKIGALLKAGDGVEVHYTAKGTANYATMIRGGVTAEAMKESGKSVMGQVTAAAADALTVTAGGKQYQFMVMSSTRVIGTGAGTLTRSMQAKGEPTKLTDFVGPKDTVIVSYQESGSMLHATEVRVTRKVK
jgi:hypothetical protein